MTANIHPAPSCLKADVWEHLGFKKEEGEAMISVKVWRLASYVTQT